MMTWPRLFGVVLFGAFAGACSDTGTQLADGPQDDPPPPVTGRPADPGLSYTMQCLATLPVDLDLRAGSRPITGIPAVTDPAFLAAADVTYLEDSDLVFGVEAEGRFMAFPARILNYHEVTTYSLDLYRYAATW